MGTEPVNAREPDEFWPSNYFNYFTEVEDHFRRARGTGLFLLSPLDWALLESWKNSGIPLQAVLRGIDLAFEKWRSRKTKVRSINSIAYCSQAVLAEAQLLAAGPEEANRKPVSAPFTTEELRVYLEENAGLLSQRAEEFYRQVGQQLQSLAAQAEQEYQDLEELERRLTSMEEKLAGFARTQMTDDDLVALRRDLDSQLKPYRGKMTADQLQMLERQYLDRRVFENAKLPRLSLFYL